MTHGFQLEGFDVAAGVDCDATCKYAFEANNRAAFIESDITTITGEEVAELYPAGNVRILVGCAPCQPFSLYSNRKSPDDKWKLLQSFASLVDTVQPEIVSMENVPRLTNHRVFRAFVASLENRGYFVTHYLARGQEYGIPQRRTRLVLFASLYGAIRLVPPTHSRTRTVRETISHLEPIPAGGVSAKDPLHRARSLSDINLKRIRATSSGGGWEEWDEQLRLKCHVKKNGQTFRSVYGRMKWDQPAPVMTTQFIGLGNGRFGHPTQDRAISLREAALFQTFAKSYSFIDPASPRVSMQAIARQIGNAVPVRLGRMVARSIKRHLRKFDVD
jgi:DNA (cytosine-5)-methyltransferase 1